MNVKDIWLFIINCAVCLYWL